MILEKIKFEEITFDQMQFADEEEFQQYMNSQWKVSPLKEQVDYINDRFEMVLRNSVNLREKVRTGEKQTNETIDVTIYEWIHLFLKNTKREMPVEGIQIGNKKGRALFELYDKKVRFEEILD